MVNRLIFMGNAVAKIFVGVVLITAGTVVGNDGLKQLGQKVIKA